MNRGETSGKLKAGDLNDQERNLHQLTGVKLLPTVVDIFSYSCWL